MASKRNQFADLGAEPVEETQDFSDLGAEPVETEAPVQEADYSDLGAAPVEEAAPAQKPGFHPLKFFEDILSGFKKTKARQDELAMAQAQAAETEQAAAQEKDADPATWSSTRFKKEAPKPRTIEEQGVYDAILKQKQDREKAITSKITGEPAAGEAPAERPDQGVYISAAPDKKKGFAGMVEALKKFYRPDMTKQQLIDELSQEFHLDAKYVEKNFDELARKKAESTGVYTQPTNEEMLNAVMVGTLPIAAAISGPLAIAKGLLAYTGIKEASERVILPAAKIIAQKLSGDEVRYEVTKFSEMFPDVGPVRDIADLSEFLIYGMAAKKATDFVGKAAEDPRVLGELAGLRYRILKALGVKQETGLVPLTDEQIKEAFGPEAWKYLSKEGLAKFKVEEAAKRGAGTGEGQAPAGEPIAPEVLKDLGAEPVLPTETPAAKPVSAEPAKMPKNKKLVEFTDFDKEAMRTIQRDIEEMEAPRRIVLKDQDAPVGEDTKITGSGFVMPYLRDFGVTKVADLPVLKKALAGEPITDKQHERVLNLMDRWINEQEKTYGKSIEELYGELPKPEAEEALRLANQDEPPPEEPEGLLQETGRGSAAQGARGAGELDFPYGKNAPAEPAPLKKRSPAKLKEAFGADYLSPQEASKMDLEGKAYLLPDGAVIQTSDHEDAANVAGIPEQDVQSKYGWVRKVSESEYSLVPSENNFQVLAEHLRQVYKNAADPDALDPIRLDISHEKAPDEWTTTPITIDFEKAKKLGFQLDKLKEVQDLAIAPRSYRKAKKPAAKFHFALSGGRYPIAIGDVPIKAEPKFGLNPGDKITRIGAPAKSGKATSASRFHDFKEPIEYEGTLEYDNDPAVSFKYKEGGKEYHLIYKTIETDAGGELILPDYKTLGVQIYKAKFTKAAFDPVKWKAENPGKLPPHLQAHVDKKPALKEVGVSMKDMTPAGYGPTPSGTGFAAPAQRSPANTRGEEGKKEGWQAKVLPADKLAKFPKELGGMEYVRALEMPELVRLAREISGKLPQVVKATGTAYGRFIGRPGSKGSIKLIAEIFKDPELAAGVLAHEIGHNIDWLPDQMLDRGNTIGRLISSVNRFMKTTFSAGGSLDLKEVRKMSFKAYLKDHNLKLGDYMKDKALRQKHAAGVKAAYADDKLKAIEAGNYLVDKDLRTELIALTKWWHPYTPVKNSTYTKYRESAVELYAEFLSVLLNAPAKALEIAPKFYNAFFEHLDKKADVKQSFFELQELLLSPEKVLKRREDDIVKMFEKSRQTFENLITQKTAAQKSLRFLLKYHFVDRNAAALEARNKIAKTTSINPEEDPKYLLEENSMMGAFVKSHLDDLDPVYVDLRKSDLDFDRDFGQYLFLKRVTNDRANMANPLGQTPETAKRQLEFMKDRLGTDRFDKLEKEYVRRVRDWFKSTNQLLAEDVLTDAQKKMVQENTDYAPFRVTEYLKEYASAGFAQQIGTLKEIENPGSSMVLKAVAMLRLYKRNAIEKGVGTFLLKNNLAEPAQVKTYDGQVHIKEREGLDVIKWREKGKWKAAYVDPYIADSFKYDDTGLLQTIGDVFQKVLLNNAFFRPLYITFNVGFQSANLIRDFWRFYKNTPGMTIPKAFKKYGEAFPASVRRVKGEYDAAIQQMERQGALNITMNDLIMGKDRDDTEIDAVLAKYGIRTPEKKPHPFLRPAVAILNGIKFAGDVIETIPKVAGFYALDKVPVKERAYMIRNYVGTPNFKRRGKMFPVYNNVFLFSNIIKEGLRSDYEAAFRNPRTRKGFWWKTIKVGLIPKILMALGAAGAFGKAIKDNYEKQTEYDKTNYITIPLFEDERGKAGYWRFPLDETTRLMSGIFWKMISRREPQDLAAFTGGQLPSLSPMLEMLTTWGEFLTGGNPRDNFRNQEILTKDEAAAGGMEAIEPMIRWTINQSGMVHMDIRDRLRDETLFEKVLAFTPIINRFIRVSDYGKSEKLHDVVAAQAKEEAQARIAEKRGIREDVRAGKTAQEASEGLGGKDRKKFIKKYEKEASRPTASPIERALTQSGSNEQKLAVLEDMQDEYETASEYRQALSGYYRDKFISAPVLREAVRRYNRRKNVRN